MPTNDVSRSIGFVVADESSRAEAVASCVPAEADQAARPGDPTTPRRPTRVSGTTLKSTDGGGTMGPVMTFDDRVGRDLFGG